MELYPKQKTEEEYVEAVRKQAARSWMFGIFHACGVFFFFGVSLFLSKLIHSTDGAMEHVSSGMHLGMMFGFMAGILILLGVQNLIWAVQYFKGNRTERLMLKYHNKLKEMEANRFQQYARPDRE